MQWAGRAAVAGAVILWGGLVACNFDGKPGGDLDAGTILEQCEQFGDRHYFDACALPGAIDVTLSQSDNWFYNTDTLTLTGPGSETTLGTAFTVDVVGGQREVALIVARSFQVPLDSTFRATGTRPLLVVSSSTIDVAGTLDVSSFYNQSAAAFSIGAGGEGNVCFTEVLDGGDRTDGSAGGAGGGFGTAGGDGGTGRNNSPAGGAGDPAKNLTGMPVRGGCAGGRSGVAEMGYSTPGGPGGGAVVLSARDGVAISGAVHAGGAGGRGQELDRRAGGGGGGSGGFIMLEASNIIVLVNGLLWAHGGGGGGGEDNATSGHNGEDATDAALSRADGGNGHNNADGGDGSGPEDDADDGSDADRGGGGGGGGAGVIVIAGPTNAIDGTVEPAARPLADIEE